MPMMPFRLLAVCLLLALAACVGGGPKLSAVFMKPGASVDTLVNAYRRQAGLNTLSRNASLDAAAGAHARDLASRGALSHKGADGSDHSARAVRAGYGPFVVENAAAGQKSVAEVMRGFVRSGEHRRNLEMDPATHYGFAQAAAPGTKYKNFYVLVIGRPPPEGDYVVRKASPGLSLSTLTDIF